MTHQINDLAATAAPARGNLPGPRRARPAEEAEVRLSEVVSALSYACDITEGQPPGHAVRSCAIAMRLGQVLHLCDGEQSALYYALLLKDLGCSSNAARLARLFQADDLALKRVHKLTDWSRGPDSACYAYRQSMPGHGALSRAWHALVLGVTEHGSGREMTQTRCERGAEIARMLGVEPATAEAIRALDEHWDGAGLPYGAHGDDIPLLGRIAGLAQTVEVFSAAFGKDAALEVARARRGTWFDPGLVQALESFEHDQAFWDLLRGTDQLEYIRGLEPADRVLLADETRLDQVAVAFARVIDAKSPYTALHSHGVAAIAVAIGEGMHCGPEDLVTLRRAGLLHDIGKLSVSNLILDKPGRLTEGEMIVMRRHTAHTLEILRRVRRFQAFADLAAAHHERLDGSGYHLGIEGGQLPPLARILAVADICEALTAERPYRRAMSRDEVLAVMRTQVGTGLCPVAFEVLESLEEFIPGRISGPVAAVTEAGAPA
ncbi:MAG TPA: HD domain-containing phosphohydrolase [Gemmatimonadales bacterium]|nr:HD domain-containing phosphohydrolase [Gemmatimonadales bacterium]